MIHLVRETDQIAVSSHVVAKAGFASPFLYQTPYLDGVRRKDKLATVVLGCKWGERSGALNQNLGGEMSVPFILPSHDATHYLELQVVLGLHT